MNSFNDPLERTQCSAPTQEKQPPLPQQHPRPPVVIPIQREMAWWWRRSTIFSALSRRRRTLRNSEWVFKCLVHKSRKWTLLEKPDCCVFRKNRFNFFSWTFRVISVEQFFLKTADSIMKVHFLEVFTIPLTFYKFCGVVRVWQFSARYHPLVNSFSNSLDRWRQQKTGLEYFADFGKFSSSTAL